MRWSVALVVAAAACAPDLRLDHPFDGQVSSGQLVRVEQDGEVRTAHIDATDKGSQVFLDLDLGKEMKADEAFSTNDWDLAFKRYEISMNGGAGNPTGVVRAAVLKDVSFESLTQALATGYQQDGATSVFNGVEGGWYFYDLGKHQLVTRADLLYVVQSSDGTYFKLQMLGYYDDKGTPASLTLRYAPVTPP